MRKQTLLTTSGCTPDDHQGAVSTPVYRASTVVIPTLEEFEKTTSGELKRYGRYGTRTNQELEQTLARLEGADCTMVFPSGLNAIWTALGAFVSQGDHILMIDSAYSPTRRICKEELSRFGVQTSFFNPTIGSDIARLIRPNTRLIYLESPGFLTMEMVDIPVISKIARQHGVIVACDNTWATPLHVKPFELGIDISIHSGTKYIGGHSDLLLGVLSFKQQHAQAIQSYAYNNGAHTSADVCYLAQRGLRTMALRLKQHQESALIVAQALQKHPLVAAVLYPPLPDDPGHQIWKRDYTGASGLLTFVLKEPQPRQALAHMLDNMQLCSMGYSWGGFESLLIPVDPAPVRDTSHWPYDGQAFRLHVGLEDVNDIIEDLEKGLARLNTQG